MTFRSYARLILALVLVPWSTYGTPTTLDAAEHTNVVIIFADDLGYGDLGCFGLSGNGRFKTPALDRMASESARLTRFYVPMPYCAPAKPSWHPDYTDEWVDENLPDGVTILAPLEQYKASQFPGVRSGDPATPMMLFDVKNDPAEQHDVANANPDLVQRLKTLFDQAGLR